MKTQKVIQSIGDRMLDSVQYIKIYDDETNFDTSYFHKAH
jgi:hypothetical protein